MGYVCLLLTAFAGSAAGVTIKGTITDASRGTALPSMVAAAYTPTGTLVMTTTSDAQGNYTLTLPADHYRLLAYDPNGAYATEFGGNADSFETSPVVNATANINSINFAMEKAGVVTGTVTSAAGSLSSVTVAAYNLTSGTRRGFTLTAPNGTYSLALAPGEYKIAAYDDAATYSVVFFQNAPTFAAATTITLVSGQQASGVDFRLPLSAHLTGSVVDGDTNGILPGSTVLAYSADGATIASSTTADANGNFTLNVPAGTYKIVAADTNRIYATGFVGDANSFANERPISVDAGQTLNAIGIPMHRAGVVAGRVTDSAGVRLQGITVAAFNDDGSQRTVARTDVDGTYTLLLPAGTYRIASYDTGLVFATQFYSQRIVFANATPVRVVAAQTIPAIDFALTHGARFSGTVTDQTTHAPVAGVSVGAYDDAGNAVNVATTDSSGNYALVIPSGSYRLVAFDTQLRYIAAYGGGAQNYDNAAVFPMVSDGTRRIDFALARGVRISGTVIDTTATFTPVSDVQIGALDLAGNRIATAIAHDGAFDLVLAPGTYKLLAVDPLGRFYPMFYNSAWTLATATAISVRDTGLSSPVSLSLVRITRHHPVRH